MVMSARKRKKCQKSVVARRASGCLFDCDRLERITSQLDAMMLECSSKRNPIEEQLTQCPEAFKAGEMIEKMFSTASLGRDEQANDERLLPPAGTVFPPLV